MTAIQIRLSWGVLLVRTVAIVTCWYAAIAVPVTWAFGAEHRFSWKLIVLMAVADLVNRAGSRVMRKLNGRPVVRQGSRAARARAREDWRRAVSAFRRQRA